MEKFVEYQTAVSQSLSDQTFVKITLGNYKGTEENLKNIYIKKVIIKNEEKLSFTYRYKTRDIVKNFTIDEGFIQIQNQLNSGFKVATLFTTLFDLSFEKSGNEKTFLRKNPPSITVVPSSDHDRVKSKIISHQNKSYLHELGITDEKGNVLKNSQDKYKQINHYIEILSSLLKEVSLSKITKIVDMGSGKGYLTFALYDYFIHTLNINPEITGVEFRNDLVELCNKIAVNSGFEKLHFTQGTIEQFDSKDVQILIALHACDTATDDAIFKGIQANAELIVVAPCCHKQIRRQIEKNKVKNELDFLTKYGIFLERQAEMTTDGIRAMILEYYGYKTKIIEFIADAHTHKNVMIVGIKNKNFSTPNDNILMKIKETKAYFGIEYHHLEKMLEI